MRRKKNKKQEEKMDDSWLLPYADMLTLLFALFIVLFAMSEVDIQRYKDLSQVFKREFSTGGEGVLDYSSRPIEPLDRDQSPTEEDSLPDRPGEGENDQDDHAAVQQEIAQLQVIQDQMSEYIEENNLSEVLGTKFTDEGLLVTVRTDISFDSGSAKVKKRGMEIAEELAPIIATDPPHQIVVSGHADDRPIDNEEFRSNWELSVMRAINFMGLLLENKDLNPDRFSAKGYGENHPIVPNTSEEARAKNRRVEVLVLPNVEIQVEDLENIDTD
ncbi:MAG TPA: flagellar motor protein MotB [Bacillota bacterium]|nr:flagellar motor protein MotB [Bacillota bacterium]